MIEVSEELAKANPITPMIIIRQQKNISILLVPLMSPYPTVVIVVIAQ